ncbi:hypothetical protein MTR67_048605 [Solanum verrucosum]|uniref:Late embryogenesis abundant protein LEA-2 subgroup domain-containing protein n=1 Tax=Solanum verrucosum TaxID=315347 RepID=A0AAF0ZZS3_SOLVR|nr:hypothetical protein MTR67_048605 [Solanum verrucosum]
MRVTIHAKSDSEVTSIDALYYVQSPSHSQQHDVEKMSYGSSPFGSPTHHYHCSPIHHSRESSTSMFSASLKNNQLAVWKRIPRTRNYDDNETGDDEEDADYDNGKSVRFYVLCFLFSFIVLFTIFSLILWAASLPFKPKIFVKGMVFENLNVQAGIDGTGVQTDMLTLNSTVRIYYRNPASFFGVHVTATPLELHYYKLKLASGQAYLYPSAYPLPPAPRTSSLGRLHTALHMPKPSQSRFAQLVHHRGHSHLLPDNLIPNFIAPSVPTHPSQHPHLRNMHFLNMWNFLITQDSRSKPPFHPRSPYAMCDIIVNVTTSLDYSPRYLKLSFLGMMKKFYEARKSKRIVVAVVEGHQIPLYGAISVLSDAKNRIQSVSLPLNLTFLIRSKAYILGRLVNPNFSIHISCQLTLKGNHLGKHINFTNSHSCTYS